MSLKIVIIDYDIGNVKSILNALEKNNVTALLSREKDEILNADGLILPGVGAFAHGMSNLSKYGLLDIIYEYVQANKPFLGICLGMQMLLEQSEEFGITKGLGLIEGSVIKLPVQNSEHEKLPHVSWNEIVQPKNISWDNTILDGIDNKSDMYFVHSYVAVPKNENNILSTTLYSDYNFCSSVQKNNIYGCQFHPEKSAKEGIKIIQNFINLSKECKNV